jgi:hypothetical protein
MPGTEFNEYSMNPKDCVRKKRCRQMSATDHGIILFVCEQEQRRVRRPPPPLVLSTSSPSTDGLCVKCSGTEGISVHIQIEKNP